MMTTRQHNSTSQPYLHGVAASEQQRLEVQADPRQGVREMGRVVKPGGWICA